MEQAPHSEPPFKFGKVKKAISPHCFNRSLLRSFSYLTFDLVIVTLLLYSTIYYFALPGILGWVLWHGYGAAQGSVLTGVWIIAHNAATMHSMIPVGSMTQLSFFSIPGLTQLSFFSIPGNAVIKNPSGVQLEVKKLAISLVPSNRFWLFVT